MAQQRGLGKGLGAIFGGAVDATSTTGAARTGLHDVPIDAIDPNPNQPRVHFDEVSLDDLSASIAALGVLQPVLVRPAVGGRYQLIAGERRWRAAQRAGLTAIPAIVREIDELASVEQALVENLHRKDLTALEEASAYQQLIDDFAMTHEQVAQRVGKSRAAVSNTLRLLQLPPSIQHLLADDQLTAGHARALLGTSDRSYQEHIARRAAVEHWSVRAVEQAIRDRELGPGNTTPAQPGVVVSPRPTTPAGTLRPASVLELEERLSEALDTRVQVSMSGSRGKLIVEFADLADLDRIFRQMTSGSGDDAVDGL